jgi:hypothetical protein
VPDPSPRLLGDGFRPSGVFTARRGAALLVLLFAEHLHFKRTMTSRYVISRPGKRLRRSDRLAAPFSPYRCDHLLPNRAGADLERNWIGEL